MRYLLVFQGKDQIRAIYGEEAANGILKAIHNEVVFAPGDIKLAEEYSKRLGNNAVRVQNQSLNRQKNEMTADRQTATASRLAR